MCDKIKIKRKKFKIMPTKITAVKGAQLQIDFEFNNTVSTSSAVYIKVYQMYGDNTGTPVISKIFYGNGTKKLSAVITAAEISASNANAHKCVICYECGSDVIIMFKPETVNTCNFEITSMENGGFTPSVTVKLNEAELLSDDSDYNYGSSDNNTAAPVVTPCTWENKTLSDADFPSNSIAEFLGIAKTGTYRISTAVSAFLNDIPIKGRNYNLLVTEEFTRALLFADTLTADVWSLFKTPNSFAVNKLADGLSIQTLYGKKTFDEEPVFPNKTASATPDGTRPASEAQVYAAVGIVSDTVLPCQAEHIQLIIDSLPKNINADVAINVIAGNADSLNIVIKGFTGRGSISINGADAVASTHSVLNLSAENNSVEYIKITGMCFKSVSDYAVKISENKCRVIIDKCLIVGGGGIVGVYAIQNVGFTAVSDSQINNCSNAVMCEGGGAVYSDSLGGTNNAIVYRAVMGGALYVTGVGSVTGNVAFSKDSGGVLFGFDGGLKP
jgi:hypothetical protein